MRTVISEFCYIGTDYIGMLYYVTYSLAICFPEGYQCQIVERGRKTLFLCARKYMKQTRVLLFTHGPV